MEGHRSSKPIGVGSTPTTPVYGFITLMKKAPLFLTGGCGVPTQRISTTAMVAAAILLRNAAIYFHLIQIIPIRVK